MATRGSMTTAWWAELEKRRFKLARDLAVAMISVAFTQTSSGHLALGHKAVELANDMMKRLYPKEYNDL